MVLNRIKQLFKNWGETKKDKGVAQSSPLETISSYSAILRDQQNSEKRTKMAAEHLLIHATRLTDNPDLAIKSHAVIFSFLMDFFFSD